MYIGVVLTQEEFRDFLGSKQPFMGFEKVDRVEFDVTEYEERYQFTTSPEVLDKIRLMKKHPYQLLVRVVRSLVDDIFTLKIFVGIFAYWEIPVDSYNCWGKVFSHMKLPQLLGFPEKELEYVIEYTFLENSSFLEENCPVDDREEMYPRAIRLD